MKNTNSKSKKICATCDYWLGARKPTNGACKYVEYESSEQNACAIKKGHTAKAIDPWCSKYQKLSWLK